MTKKVDREAIVTLIQVRGREGFRRFKSARQSCLYLVLFLASVVDFCCSLSVLLVLPFQFLSLFFFPSLIDAAVNIAGSPPAFSDFVI